MSRPSDPCGHCGAMLWEVAEVHNEARHYWVPVYRCRECAHDAPPTSVPVLVGAD